MGSAIVGITLTLGTLYLCCAIVLVWSTRSQVPLLSRILRYSGILAAIWLTICLALFAYLTTTCSGNWLYGFTDCARISNEMAERLTAVSMLSYIGGAAYGVALLIVGGITEVIVRAKAP